MSVTQRTGKIRVARFTMKSSGVLVPANTGCMVIKITNPLIAKNNSTPKRKESTEVATKSGTGHRGKPEFQTW